MSDDQARRRAASDLNLQGRISTDYQTRQHQATQDLLAGGRGDHEERYNAFIHGGTPPEADGGAAADQGAGNGMALLILAGIALAGGLLYFVWLLLTDPFFAADVMTNPIAVGVLLLAFALCSLVLPATAIAVMATLALVSSGGNFAPEWLIWPFRDIDHLTSVIIMLAAAGLVMFIMRRVEMKGLASRPVALGRFAWISYVVGLVIAGLVMVFSSDATAWPQSTAPAGLAALVVTVGVGIAVALWRFKGRTFAPARLLSGAVPLAVIGAGMVLVTLAMFSVMHRQALDVGTAPFGRAVVAACTGEYTPECTNADVMFANLRNGYFYEGDTLPRWFADRTYIKDYDPALWDDLTTGVKSLSVRADSATTAAEREAIVRDYAHLAVRLNSLMEKNVPKSSYLFHPLRPIGGYFDR